MKVIFLSLIIQLLASVLFSAGYACDLPDELKKEIRDAVENPLYSEDDFFRVNSLLFEYEHEESLTTLPECAEYKNSIGLLFNSQNIEKRVLAYRLIGIVKDTAFNYDLVQRLHSDESSLSKTWIATAIMANKTPNSSDALFKLLTSNQNGLPVTILVQMYLDYDTLNVKKSCWSYIDSQNRTEQILAIQCLAHLEKGTRLQSKLLEFLDSWEMESKGWVISSMAMQKMGNLMPVLQKYSSNEGLKGVIIRALRNSPTPADAAFAEALEN